MNTISLKLAFLSVAVCGTASVNAASILANGSFENYAGTGFNTNTGAGLANWTVGGGGIDLIIPAVFPAIHWIAQDGNVSLSLNWFGPGSITQSITTITGDFYAISFYMGAELNGGPAIRTMNVVWNGSVVGAPSFNYANQPLSNMGWQKFSFVVQGTGIDTLTFASTTGANYGPALDNVEVTLVPEPTTVMSFIVGTVGLAFNRRRLR